MARASDYSHADVVLLAEQRGFEHLAGDHVNGQSQHQVKCLRCGATQVKSSKQLASKRGSCGFQPCSAKGKLSLAFLRAKARENNVLLERGAPKGADPSSLIVGARELLVWRKHEEKMTSSWDRIHRRTAHKHGAFFVPDSSRRPKRPPLGPSEIEDACRKAGLHLSPANFPTGRDQQRSYTILKCGHLVELSFNQVDTFSFCEVCELVNQLSRPLLALLESRQMLLVGPLTLMENKKQLNRSQLVSLSCLMCGNSNNARSFTDVRYRGFVYCDSFACVNHFLEADQPRESCDYYVNLFRSAGCNSVSMAQSIYPRSMHWLKRHTPTFREIARQLNWPTNRMARPNVSEVEATVRTAVGVGRATISSLLSHATPEERSVLNKAKSQGLLRPAFEATGSPLRIVKHQVESLGSAVEFCSSNEVTSWGMCTSRFPGFAGAVSQQGLRDQLVEKMGWKALENFSRLTNEELFRRGHQLVEERRASTLAELNPGLVAQLNSRRLSERFCAREGINRERNWRSRDLNEFIDEIAHRDISTLTEFHAQLPGAYKRAVENGWLQELALTLEWGSVFDIDGQPWHSHPEVWVGNVMHVGGIEFLPHPRIDAFRGRRGGVLRADMLIPMPRPPTWVEVWAISHPSQAGPEMFRDYWENRRYKEENADATGMRLCSIEGRLLHQDLELDGTLYKRGPLSLIAHAIARLSAAGIEIDLDPSQALQVINASTHRLRNGLPGVSRTDCEDQALPWAPPTL